MRLAKYLMIAFMALVLVMLYYSATTPAEPASVSGPASGAQNPAPAAPVRIP